MPLKRAIVYKSKKNDSPQGNPSPLPDPI